jgi:hypothetical protein
MTKDLQINTALKELIWIRQFIHKKDDENVVIRDATGKEIASWLDRVDAVLGAQIAQAAQRTEQNFCSRCGKRTADLTTIHTCTPPQENT